ncbi:MULTISPECIES: HipA family kinase [Luteimonas]|uniref:HipA family kinase n=1 Tax=Luteimonas TaxID=83614 RepID=UPI000C7C08C4|nr:MULTISPECIES: HipA family kinase [Luteimonas]
MRTVDATRYVTPLREGGSLPAVVEADDDGMYVMKFRGAGQGAKALVAELIAGEFARLLALPIPELVLMTLDPGLAATEPDPEIQHLIRASDGCNVGLDYLPGALNFDPAVDPPDADLASRIVWFDAFVCNVDRTARNTNLLVWHRALWLIDHGAALYFHHDWSRAPAMAATPFARIADHVLLPFASRLAEADAALVTRITEADIRRIVDVVPDLWLDDPAFDGPAANRQGYVDFFCARLRQRAVFVEEAQRAHAGRL